MQNYAETARKYCEDIISGKILACNLVKLACQRHLNDLEKQKLKDFPYRFDEKKANARCAFSEKFTHVKGKWAGQKLKLEPHQIFAQCAIWGWVKKSTGFRRFTAAYQEAPRKNGKSVTAATAGLYMLTADGEMGAEVYSGASTEKQALEVFRPAWLMANGNGDFRSHFGISLSGTPKNPTSIYKLEDMSRFELLVGNPGDGASPHCAIIDEYHEHRTSDQYDTMDTGMGAREQPLMFVITTAGTDTSSPCYDLHLKAIKVLDGTIEDDSFFALIYGIDNKSQTISCMPSIDALRKMEDLCTCGHAKTTLVEKYLQGDYAQNAITENGKNQEFIGNQRERGKKRRDARIIQVEQLKQMDSAQHVVVKNSSIRIQKNERPQTDVVSNGQKTTQIELEQPKRDLQQRQDTKNTNKMLRSSMNTELQKTNIINFAKNMRINVQYAEDLIENFVSTIAIKQELLEEFYVGNAIQPSDCLEILKTACKWHSDTCKIHQNKIEVINDFISITVPPDDFRDFDVWKKANPNYLISIQEDYLKRKYNETMTDASKQNINLCKHLNVWTNAGVAWMNMVKLALCVDNSLKLEDFEGQPCYAALDLASKIDICARILLFQTDKGFAAFGKYYLPEDTVNLAGNEHYVKWVKEGWITQTPGARTDYLYIEDDFKEINEKYPIIELAFDPREATYLINNVMEWLGEERCIEISQGPALMSEPMKELEALIYSNKFFYNGDPVLTWMIGNVVKKQGRNSGPVKYYYPTKEKNENKIDGAVALIMAIGRAMLQENTDSVYETRGVLVL